MFLPLLFANSQTPIKASYVIKQPLGEVMMHTGHCAARAAFHSSVQSKIRVFDKLGPFRHVEIDGVCRRPRLRPDQFFDRTDKWNVEKSRSDGTKGPILELDFSFFTSVRKL